MATLILTAVGTAVGGPIGGAIGAIIGQQADAAILAPKRREGPRLGDLAVQTSSYGTPIPKVFGRLRVAGTVIWSTDLVEHRSTSGGGKGRPATVGYSYSASFAVALSARPIRGIGRIWADGKLLRGAAGDFKSATGFRLHLGDEEQKVDPLIAAVEGIGSTPAYLGLAYAVFEDFQLADYGNRIPSLSFEIVADEEPVAIGAIAAELSEGTILAGETPALIGHPAGGDGVRGAIEGFARLMDLPLIDAGTTLRLGSTHLSAVEIAREEAGARAKGESGGRTEFATSAASSIPGEVSVTYVDPSRDWQTSVQRARIDQVAAYVERVVLPAAVDAEHAKALAEARLASLWAGRSTVRLHLGWSRATLRPGGLVRIEGVGGLWRIERWTLRRMVVTLELIRVAAGAPAEIAATTGRPVRQPDLAHGPTVVRLLDIPLGSAPSGEHIRLLVAASGPEPGWRGGDLSISLDSGTGWASIGRTASPAVMGSAVTSLTPAGAARFDTRNVVEVQLLNDAMWLESRDDAALVGGANLALLGGELLQFGRVEPLGDRRFRLSKLLRGRRGTEWAASDHVAGEPFLLLDSETLTAADVRVALLGGEARIMARGLGDDLPASEAIEITGEGLRPPAPVHLRARVQGNGDIAISWVRRSRAGWYWLDGTDAPVAEEQERYQLRLLTGSLAQTLTVGEPHHLHTAGAQTGDGGGPLTVEIRQTGTFAASRPATITVERI